MCENNFIKCIKIYAEVDETIASVDQTIMNIKTFNEEWDKSRQGQTNVVA